MSAPVSTCMSAIHQHASCAGFWVGPCNSQLEGAEASRGMPTLAGSVFWRLDRGPPSPCAAPLPSVCHCAALLLERLAAGTEFDSDWPCVRSRA